MCLLELNFQFLGVQNLGVELWVICSKGSACNVGNLGSILGQEYLGSIRVGEGNGNPFLYSCLENPMDRGTWWAIVHGVTKSQTPLSD